MNLCALACLSLPSRAINQCQLPLILRLLRPPINKVQLQLIIIKILQHPNLQSISQSVTLTTPFPLSIPFLPRPVNQETSTHINSHNSRRTLLHQKNKTTTSTNPTKLMLRSPPPKHISPKIRLRAGIQTKILGERVHEQVPVLRADRAVAGVGWVVL